MVKQGVPISVIREMDCISSIKRMRLDYPSENFRQNIQQLSIDISEAFIDIRRRYSEFIKVDIGSNKISDKLNKKKERFEV